MPGGLRATNARGREQRELTIAWNPRKRDIQIHGELLPSRLVDEDGRLDVNLAVVVEFESDEGEDDGEGEHRH
jgi:hypothetical protein